MTDIDGGFSGVVSHDYVIYEQPLNTWHGVVVVITLNLF